MSPGDNPSYHPVTSDGEVRLGNELELHSSEVVGTAKAARWLSMSERQITRMCRQGKLQGAYQPSGFLGKWLIPIRTLEAIYKRPEGL